MILLCQTQTQYSITKFLFHSFNHCLYLSYLLIYFRLPHTQPLPKHLPLSLHLIDHHTLSDSTSTVMFLNNWIACMNWRLNFPKSFYVPFGSCETRPLSYSFGHELPSGGWTHGFLGWKTISLGQKMNPSPWIH